MKSYLNSLAPTAEQPRGAVRNNGGGFSFQVDAFARLERFLILGSEGGTYYSGKRDLDQAACQALLELLNRHSDNRTSAWTIGKAVVDMIVDVSEKGRAPKNDPAILALAVVAKKSPHVEVRQYALMRVNRVCRTGTHILHFAQAVEALGGWGRGTKGAFSTWYHARSEMDLAHQVTKYAQRDGWSHRDILRKAHPTSGFKTANAIFEYITKGTLLGEEMYFGAPVPERTDCYGDVVKYLWAVEQVKHMGNDPDGLVEMIEEFKLPREVLPTQALQHVKVWDAMLPHMGGEALLRNLGKMTSIDVLRAGSLAENFVAERFSDADFVRQQRLHPIKLLVAMSIYGQGKGDKGDLTWQPRPMILDALQDAFYASFDAVEPTNKRQLLCLDVSGSMNAPITAAPTISCRAAMAAMAMIAVRTEKQARTMGFSSRFKEINLSRYDGLEVAMQKTYDSNFGDTDCSLPMVWAAKNQIPVDAFVVYTDSETNVNRIAPSVALQRYRDAMGIPAKMIVVAMTSDGFTIADPNDSGMLDVVGFDTAAPAVMADFIVG